MTPDSRNVGVADARWRALEARSSESLAVGFEVETGCVEVPFELAVDLDRLRAAACTPLAQSLTAPCLAWEEPDCNNSGTDYDYWFGGGESWLYMTQLRTERRVFWSQEDDPRTHIWPTHAQMYVR